MCSGSGLKKNRGFDRVLSVPGGSDVHLPDIFPSSFDSGSGSGSCSGSGSGSCSGSGSGSCSGSGSGSCSGSGSGSCSGSGSGSCSGSGSGSVFWLGHKNRKGKVVQKHDL